MTMVDYCPRPKAEGNSPSGQPRHQGAMVLTIHQTAMKQLFYYPTASLKRYTAINEEVDNLLSKHCSVYFRSTFVDFRSTFVDCICVFN